MFGLAAAQALLRRLPEALAEETLAPVAERIALTIEALLDDELKTTLPPLPPPPEAMDVSASIGAPGAVGAPTDAEDAAMEDAEGAMSAPLLSEWSSYLGALLASLHSPTVRAQKPLVKALTQLLPLVTRGERPLMAQLLGALAPYAAFDAYDESLHQDAAHTFGLECLVATLSSFKGAAASPLAQRIKRAVLEHRLHATGANLASTAAAYLVSRLPSNMDTGSQLWAAALARPALPYVLQLLGGLAQGHDAVQTLLLTTDGVMTRLHALERQSSSASKAIGTLAESLLEALRERAAADVDQLRRETTESKRKAALDKRQRMLKSMGMDTGAGNKVIVSQAAPTLLEELKEEQGHVCVVCGEGEAYRPGDILGCYTFCKRVPILAAVSASGSGGAGTAAAAAAAHLSPLAGGPGSGIGSAPGSGPASGGPGSGGAARAVGGGAAATEMCYTTVSHFNLIHFSCHRDATRAERALKNPKEEWEGATLRNSQTKCNNLLPLHTSTVSEETYAIHVEQWWANVSHLGRVDGPRCRLLCHDIKLLLLRFGLEESFSNYSKGGGRESNLKLLPYLVQMAAYLLDARASPQRRSFQRALASYVSSCAQDATDVDAATSAAAAAAAAAAAGGGTLTTDRLGTDSPLYYFVLSLLVHSPAEWRAARMPMLRRAVASWRLAGHSREKFSLAGPASPPGVRPSRSPGLGASRSPLDPSPVVLPVSVGSPGVGAASGADGGASAAATTPVERNSAGGGLSAGASGGVAFFEARPVILFFGLVERLHGILKPVPGPSDAKAAAEAPEAWVDPMKERLRSQEQELLQQVGELLREYEEEFLVAESAHEVFDVLGLHGAIGGAGLEPWLGGA